MEISDFKKTMLKSVNRNMFSKKAQEYITNEMSICIDDLTYKILNDVPKNSLFFNDLFEYMIELELPHSYDLDVSSPINDENNEFLNNKLCDFFKNSGFDEKSLEYFIYDNIRHAFLHFKEGGILQMYQHREAEIWYPKVIIKKFLGIQTDIDKLENKITVYRGTSREEYDSKKYGQSWTLNENVAKEFAFIHYSSQEDYQNTKRVLLSTVVDKKSIFYYDKNGAESEIIVDTAKLNKDLVRIVEDRTLGEYRCQISN